MQGPGYEWSWFYGAFEPASGERFLMEWSHLDGECFARFIREFEDAYAQEGVTNVMVLDGAGAHHAKVVEVSDSTQLWFLPAYSPELNPSERMWEDMRASMSAAYAKLEDVLEGARRWWNDLDDDAVKSLTCFPYIATALAHISSS